MFLSIYCSNKVKARYSLINNVRYIPYQILKHTIRNIKYTFKTTSSIQFNIHPKYIEFKYITIDYSIYYSSAEDMMNLVKRLLKGLILNYIAYEPRLCLEKCKVTIILNNEKISLDVYEGNKILIKIPNTPDFRYIL